MFPDTNLLFAVLALKSGYISREQFVAACNLWSSQPQTTIANLFVNQGWMTTEARAAVEELVAGSVGWLGAGSSGSSSGEGTLIQDLSVPMAAPISHPGEGGVSSRYLLKSVFAVGGMGRVWLAFDTRLEREVALKELKPAGAANATAQTRMEREARVTGRLQHPGIVPVYDVEKKVGTTEPFYTMPLVSGQTLADAIAAYHHKPTPLALRDLLNAFTAVCYAVGYAHSRGVIHRDLKPHNVVLGDHGEVIVLDWGIARVVVSTNAVQTADPTDPPPVVGWESGGTVAGGAIGTPAYMPPEQAEGRSEDVSHLSDVFGLGAILYHILTGHAPYSGETAVRQARECNPPPPRAVNPRIPRPLDAICRKCLGKKPALRYASATMVADEVRRFLADEPVKAYRDPVLAQLGRWTRRHRSLVASLLAAGTVLAITGTWLGVSHSRKQERERVEAALQAEREAREVEKLRHEADERHAAGVAAARAGDLHLAATTLSELLGFCRRTESLSGKQQEVASQLRQVEQLRTFKDKSQAALQSDDIDLPGEPLSGGRGGDPVLRLCEDALTVYGVFGRTDWQAAIRTSMFTPTQIEEIRHRVHELLLIAAPRAARVDATRGLQMLDLADKIEPPGTAIWLLRRQWYAKTGNEAAAKHAQEMVIKTSREGGIRSARDFTLIASANYQLGDYDRALNGYREALRANPGYFRGHFGLFQCYAEKKDYQAQLPPLSACLILRPNDPTLYYLRGMTYFQMGRHTDAYRDFDTAVARDPNYKLGYFYRGRMLVTDGKWREAEEDFTRTLNIDPTDTYARAWRAIARAKTGKHREAAADAEQAVREETDARDSVWIRFYSARALAVAVAAVREDGMARDRAALIEKYGARSVELLVQSIKLGFRDFSRVSPGSDFEPVRNRTDFPKLPKGM